MEENRLRLFLEILNLLQSGPAGTPARKFPEYSSYFYTVLYSFNMIKPSPVNLILINSINSRSHSVLSAFLTL